MRFQRRASPLVTAVFAMLACRETAPARPAGASVTADAAAASDARSQWDAALAAPATLDDALRRLRERGFAAAADVIARRTRQRRAKMKLNRQQALAAAHAVLAVAARPPMRALCDVMPRSQVELSRAVAERGVSLSEADAIARYLLRVTSALAFERLHVFDDNHSHVIGRQWHEIDYSGESMTWQAQRAYWQPRGVHSFTRVVDIHAYFVGAERMAHWRRVYRPRGAMSSVSP